MKQSVNVGDRFGSLTVIEKDSRPRHRSSWLCRCDCGNEIYVITSQLLRNAKHSCGCKNRNYINEEKDLTGLHFGQLTVISRIRGHHNTSRWLCRCECGNICERQAANLLNGRAKTCGQHWRTIPTEKLLHKRFGYLTVIKRSDDPKHRSIWYCLCDCGNIIKLTTSDLLNGHNRSCGKCRYRFISQMKPLIGKRFHYLTVKNIIQTSKNQYRYLCQCDCGEFTLASRFQLTSDSKKDCGCGLGITPRAISRAQQLQTSGKIRSSKSHSNTGYKGIHKRKRALHPYTVQLTCQGLHMHIGSFATLEEAIAARKAAEEKYYHPLIEQMDNMEPPQDSKP